MRLLAFLLTGEEKRGRTKIDFFSPCESFLELHGSAKGRREKVSLRRKRKGVNKKKEKEVEVL